MSVIKTALSASTKAARLLVGGSHMGSRAFKGAAQIATASSLASGAMIKKLLTKDKAKFVAGLVAYGLVDETIDEVFAYFSEDGDPELLQAAEEARGEIERYRLAAGVDVTPEEDGIVANHSASDMASHVAMYETAKQYFEDAARAVGGKNRLLAIMHWLAVDDDLKQVVINNEFTS